MKTKFVSVCLITLACFVVTDAQAQGLSGIGQNMSGGDFEDEIPFSVTVGGGIGYDSNTTTSSINKNDSAYINGGIGAVYGIGNKRTQVNFGGHFSAIYYFDQAPGFDDDFYNLRFTIDVVHRASPRLTITNNSYFTYEIEPDYAIGASTARRADQYFYYYNRLAATYAWSRTLSTVTWFTVSGIQYDDSGSPGAGLTSFTEDRLNLEAGNQFRYALTRNTSLTGDYRYMRTEFDNTPRVTQSHFLLVGVDHAFTRTTTGSLSVGAQFYDDSVSGSDTAPYLESALNYRLTEDTNIRWAQRLGYESNEIAGFDRRYTYRTGITASHKFTPYITGILGFSYTHSKFDGNPFIGTMDIKENGYFLNTGINYRICPNTDLKLHYYYTDYSSDSPFRDYDRHRVSLGVAATF